MNVYLTILTVFFIVIAIGIIVLIAINLLPITEIFWGILATIVAFVFGIVNHKLKGEKSSSYIEYNKTNSAYLSRMAKVHMFLIIFWTLVFLIVIFFVC